MKKITALFMSLLLVFSISITATATAETNSTTTGMSEHVFETNNVEHYTLLEELSAESNITVRDGSVSTMSINGTDDRVLVTNTEVQPYSAIAYIEVYWGIQYPRTRGTGFMVSDNVVLTAAHVLYNPEKGGWPISVKVYPGKNGDGLFDNPYDSSYASKIGVCTEWREASDIGYNNETTYAIDAYDWGAIKLILSLGKFSGYLPFRCPTSEELAFDNLTLCGYPKNVTGIDGDLYQQYKSTGTVLTYFDDYFNINMDGSGGQSGSPVYNENNVVYGIYIGKFKYGVHNAAIRITDNIIYHVNRLINE
ncbi:MAG: trypsin-like serine peptidase [Acutalibacteraceae bacterium]